MKTVGLITIGCLVFYSLLHLVMWFIWRSQRIEIDRNIA